jgi:beta-glucanase (GH16 family)
MNGKLRPTLYTTRSIFGDFATLLLCVIVGISLTGCTEPIPARGEPNPSVFDDFSGPAGARPDPKLWAYDVGPSSVHGWEAGSVETYTDSPDNVRLDGQGHLVIEARRAGNTYTSGRLVTRGKLNMLYGRMSARIKMPTGQGLWSAFWLVGADERWPDSGEIDVIELPSETTTYYTTVHGPISGTGGHGIQDARSSYTQFSGPIDDLSRDFHEYWVERRPEKITVGIDDQVLGVFTPSSLSPGSPWAYDHPMYALLNVAVGGDWPGPPDESTPFPAAMLVDWFRFDPNV